MKNTTQPLKGLQQKLSRIVSLAKVNELALGSGFIQRKARKLLPLDFVLSFFMCLKRGSCSLSQWAAELQGLCGRALSKQGLHERLNQGAERFCKGLLSYVLQHCVGQSKQLQSVLCGFASVLLQDSTCFSLKDSLRPYYRGNTACGVKKAVVRLKTIWDLRALQLLHWGITPYTHNDQSAVANVHPYVRKGVLVLRDLGYYSMDSFKKIAGRGAYFLSRLRFNTSLYDQVGRPLSLKKLLKQKVVDRHLLLCKEHLPVRLVMLPVSKAVWQRRIERAKKDRDHRSHHSPLYYKFLGYDVFVTNCEHLSAHKLRSLYTLRWQVEVLFKALKTGALNTKALLLEIRTNPHRVGVVLSLMLCFVLLTFSYLYQPFYLQLPLSVLKVLRWMCCNLIAFALFNEEQLKAALQHYCCFEKRKRINLHQKLKQLT